MCYTISNKDFGYITMIFIPWNISIMIKIIIIIITHFTSPGNREGFGVGVVLPSKVFSAGAGLDFGVHGYAT